MKHFIFSSILISFICLCFALEVSGEQYGLWTVEDSPYLLTGDVEVPEGTMLVIQPGVVVRAMGNYRLNVNGELQAIGTEQDSIRFENGQTPPTMTWKGVRLANNFLQSNFMHCIFEYAEYGISAVDSPMEVSYSRFSYNNKGMQLYGIGNPNPAVMNVHHNLVEHSVQNGILIPQNSNAHIHYNEVRYNGTSPQYYGAIQLSNQSQGGQNSPLIEHNYIHHNFKQGITAWDVVGANAIHPTIRYNHIEGNLTGIYLLNSSGTVHDNIIINNFIAGDANSGAGMMIGGATSAPYIAGNTLTGNFTAFYITQNAVPTLGELNSAHPFAYGENIIQNNIDESGTMHSIACASYTAGSNIIMAQNNDWGAYTADEIALGITDHSSNPSFPTIIFEPWLEPAQPLIISGSFAWNPDEYENILPEALVLDLISTETGIVLGNYALEENPFSFEAEVDEPFYAILRAADIEENIWAAPGGLADILPFEPDGQSSIDLGEIYIEAGKDYERRWSESPVIIDGISLTPYKQGFLVYQPTDIDYLYDEGDYRYIYRHSYLVDTEYESITFEGGEIYEKIANISHGDSWQATYTKGGTVSSYQALAYIDQAGELSISYKDEEGQMVTQSFIGIDDSRTYLYDEDGYADNYLDIISITPNQKHIYARINEPNPTNLCYRILEETPVQDGNDIYSRQILFWWQAPARNDVVSYSYYKLLAHSEHYSEPVLNLDISFDECFVQTQLKSEGRTTITLTATDGEQYSEPANTITLEFWVSNSDLVQSPKLYLYPNPINFGRGELLQMKAKDLVNAKIKVYNVKGQLVFEDVLRGEDYSWNGKNSRGKALSSGVYLMRIEADNFEHKRKILIRK